MPTPSKLAASRVAFSAALLTALAGSTASAQWTVINLHPSGATNSEARGVFAGQQAGVINNAGAAYVWTGSAPSAVKLTPVVLGQPTTGVSSTLGATGLGGCVSGGQQGGSVSVLSPSQGVGNFSHASIWNSAAGSWMSLHPSDPLVLHSGVNATDGTTQVGYYAVASGATFSAGQPALWHGTPESFVSLLPDGIGSGEARGVHGNQQVGATFDTGLGLACMWTGTAASYVSLNPITEPASFASAAQCTDGVHQYGQIATDGLYPTRWSGTAESFEVMGPAGRWGEVDGCDGDSGPAGVQVGLTTDTTQADQRAYLWHGPGVSEDLSVFLPANYDTSAASGVWRHAPSGTIYVVGYAQNTSQGNRREAFMWVNGPGVNLITSPVAPGDCTVAVGGSMNYSVRVLNAGPVTSGPITLTVDLPPMGVAAYASAVPAPTSVSATQLIFDLSPLAGAGAFTDVAITLTAAGGGATATITANAATTGEVDPTNNTAAASAEIQPTAPAVAPAKGIFSTITTQANSLVPGGGGARFTTLNRPFSSPSGNWWVQTAVTSAATAQNLVLMRVPTGGSPTVVAQKGVTIIAPTRTLSTADVGTEVNDSGVVAFAGTDNSPSATNRFIATTNGTTITEVARRGGQIPSMAAGIFYGANVGASANIFANGQVGFSTDTSPAGNDAYLSDNGATIIARNGVTMLTAPSGTFPINTTSGNGIVRNNTNGGISGGINFDATGTHYVYQAGLNTGSTTNDTVIVADGTVIMQEGNTVIAGGANPVDGLSRDITVGGSGTWLIHGKDPVPTTTPPSAANWVVRGTGSTIAQVYRDGDPIYTGATETWRTDLTITGGGLAFFAQFADGQGNYVIGGTTSNPDTFANSVLVYNDQTVLARENDPVDLDGNGVFDDGVYIRTFNTATNNALQDGFTFVHGGVLALVTLRDATAALCHLGDASVGTALVFIPLPCPADFNHSGAVSVQDIFDFLAAYFTNAPAADFNHSGTVSVQDIFDFLAAYFAGC